MRTLSRSTFAAGRSKSVPLDNETSELIQTMSVSLGLTSAYHQGVPVDLYSKVVLNDTLFTANYSARSKKRDNYTVAYRNPYKEETISFGYVSKFITCKKSSNVAIIIPLNV